MERRRFPRLAKTFRVSIRLRKSPSPEAVETESFDVGVGGLAVWVKKPIPPGRTLRLTIHGLRPNQEVQLTGRVVWCAYNEKVEANEVGIELLGLDGDRLEKLLMLISERGWTPGRPQDSVLFDLTEDVTIEFRPSGSKSRRDWLKTSTRRLSLREIVISTHDPPARGADLEMRLLPPDGDSRPLSCRSAVRKVQAGRKSNEWWLTVDIQKISDEDRLRLAAFLSAEVITPPQVQ